MTKKELLNYLDKVPDDYNIAIVNYDSYKVEYEKNINSIEINNELRSIYIILEEDLSFPID